MLIKKYSNFVIFVIDIFRKITPRVLIRYAYHLPKAVLEYAYQWKYCRLSLNYTSISYYNEEAKREFDGSGLALTFAGTY